jgi:hypothetical protein
MGQKPLAPCVANRRIPSQAKQKNEKISKRQPKKGGPKIKTKTNLNCMTRNSRTF